MYEFIQAEERHIDQLVPLLASTGYWDFGLKHNALNISNREFMKEDIVKPYLPFTNILVKKEDDEIVLGTIVCATKKALTIMVTVQNIFNFELT
jgi:hypothetical protein